MGIKITRDSELTGKSHTMEINCTVEQLREWRTGPRRLVQETFTEASAEEREFILTGITPEEWKQAFGEDDD